MATRTRPDSAKAVKQKTGTDAGQAKRTTGTLGRSSSSGGKSTGSATPQRSPSSLKSTQSASRADPSKPGKKEPGVGPTKPSPTPSRRQSIDRAPSAAQTQKVLSAGPRERSVTVRSPSLSSPSKTTPSRAEVGKSKTSPKPTAPTRAGSGSGSRSGSTVGRTVKKSSTPSPSPSPKPERTHHISDAIEAELEKSQVIVDEETLTPPPPQPTIDDHSKFEVDDEPLEHDALIEEEGHIHNQEEHEEKLEPEAEAEGEEEEDNHESNLRATPTDEEESSKETEAIEAMEENHDDTVFEKSNENDDLEDNHYENRDHEDEPDHQDMPDEGGTTTKSPPTEEPPLEKIEPAAEAEETQISSPETIKEPKKNFIEGTGDSTKIEALTFSKSPQKLQIRAPNSSSGKKDSPVSNDVIKEAAGKLLEKRRNRVSALVGAFETVISLQEPDA